MEHKIEFFDLFAGAGGMSKGFIDAGFNVVAAVEEDEYTRQIYKELISSKIPIMDNFSLVSVENLPDFDVLISRIYYSFTSNGTLRRSLGKMPLNHFVHVLQVKKPKAFLLESSLAFLKLEKAKNHLNIITEQGYVYSSSVIKTNPYTGLPVDETKLYIIGFRKDIQSEAITFPQNSATQIKINEIVDFHATIPENYYKRNIRIENISEFESHKIYIIKDKHLIQKDRINFYSYPYSTLLIDDNGIRKLTLNELAILKGLSGINYEVLKNRAKTEKAICASSNVYVIRELANIIRRTLGYKKKTLESIDANSIKYSMSLQLNADPLQTYRQSTVKATKSASFKKEISKADSKEYPKHNRKINSIYIEKLKGLKNVEITFDKPLTAIMGTNGSGKSTILHALACTYKSINDKCEKYMFSNFFLPNPDSSWKGSKLSINYSYMVKDKTYPYTMYSKKDIDRWEPRYSNRPDRNVYYIGINSCVPDIEAEKRKSYIAYTTKFETDNLSNQIRDHAKNILHKNYSQLTNHGTKHKNYIGVELKTKNIIHQAEQEIAATTEETSLVYSSLSMGTGEQRVFKILRTVLSAEKESLILIDEIDLLLHASALKKLIVVLSDVATSKNLQIIFTTHSLLMQEMLNILDIRFIQNLDDKTIVYNNIYNDAIYALTGSCLKPIRVFVEDELAKGILHHLLKELDMKSLVQVTMFGDARNAFTLASGEIIRNADVSNTLIIIDGDVYVSIEEKNEQIKKVFSGTEEDKDDKRLQALSIIKQFDLSGEKYPEKYIFNILKDVLKNYENENEIKRLCGFMVSFDDSHKYIDEIISALGEEYDVGLRDILSIISKSPGWVKYVADIKSWLLAKKEVFSSSLS